MKTLDQICLVFLALVLTSLPVTAASKPVMITGLAKVFDGDTMEIGPILIRLHGIDAPETGQSCASSTGGTWRCGASAANRIAELVDGEEIICEALERDKYGRIISRCMVNDLDLAEQLATEGLAWAYTEFSADYQRTETEARDRGIGIWQATTQTPWDYRDDKWNRAVTDAPDGCPIKGNISLRTGEKIYHTPWSPNYSSTVINENDGERWFCDEAEALAAGWRQRRP